MIRRNRKLFRGIVCLLVITPILGCHPQQPAYLFEDGDLSHYIGEATRIEYPDAKVDPIPDVADAISPFTLENPKPGEIWELELQEAVRIALENSKVMRNLGGVAFGATGTQGEPSALLSNPGAAVTQFDPAIVETNPRFGAEAALAAFDGQFAASVGWEKGDTPQNSAALPTRPTILQSDVGTFQAQLSKMAATGGQFSIAHNWQYETDNIDPAFKLYPSSWSSNVEASISQPLLQGAGVQINRIAGPGAVPGFYNGVMIARIREDVSLADFEMSVRNLVYDVERAYWNLYFMYRRLDSVKQGRDAALATWRNVYAKALAGHAEGTAQNVFQSQQQYYIFQSEVQRTLSNLYKTEATLRYIMGIAATDGRLIRPADEPTDARVTRYDWNSIQSEALCRSPELRRQRWVVKQRDLELKASKNFLMPRLDWSATYRWLGLGDALFPRNGSPDESAFESMVSGDYAEWESDISLVVPIGYRTEMAGVRNAQLEMAKAKAVLQEMELELSHQMADAKRSLEEYYRLSETNFNRRLAAEGEVRAVEAAFENGMTTLNQVLDAQRRLAEAETEYYRNIVDYNIAIATIESKKGSLLEYNGVSLAEGPWPAKAYFDATRLARARDASFFVDYGYTRPGVISRGEYQQHAGREAMPVEVVSPEVIATPQGVPTIAAPPAPATSPNEQKWTSPMNNEPPAAPEQAPQQPGDAAPAVMGPSADVHLPARRSPHRMADLQSGLRELTATAGEANMNTGLVKQVGYQQPVVNRHSAPAPVPGTANAWMRR